MFPRFLQDTWRCSPQNHRIRKWRRASACQSVKNNSFKKYGRSSAHHWMAKTHKNWCDILRYVIYETIQWSVCKVFSLDVTAHLKASLCHLAGQPSDAEQVPIVATGDRLEQREDRIANGSWDLAIQEGGNPKPHGNSFNARHKPWSCLNMQSLSYVFHFLKDVKKWRKQRQFILSSYQGGYASKRFWPNK